jgi:hypothetical protein
MRQLGDGTTPFIAPALAGLPMVDGLPEYEDIGWAEVGWAIRSISFLRDRSRQRTIRPGQSTRHETTAFGNCSF